MRACVLRRRPARRNDERYGRADVREPQGVGETESQTTGKERKLFGAVCNPRRVNQFARHEAPMAICYTARQLFPIGIGGGGGWDACRALRYCTSGIVLT